MRCVSKECGRTDDKSVRRGSVKDSATGVTQTCKTSFARVYSKFRAPLFPLRQHFLWFVFTQNSIVRFLSRNYPLLRISAQHRRPSRRYIASHAAPSTVSWHSTDCQNFTGVSPDRRFQQAHKFLPTSINFCTRRSLCFVHTQLIKIAELLSFAHTSSQIEVAAHSKRFSTRRNLSQTTCPAVTQSQTSLNQHSERLARVFQTTSASARNHLLHSV